MLNSEKTMFALNDVRDDHIGRLSSLWDRKIRFMVKRIFEKFICNCSLNKDVCG